MSDPAAPVPPSMPFPPDENATVVLSDGGASAGSPSHGENPLPVGHVLQEYVIEGLIGEGGFGIVYLARDTQLGRVVAIKEYMPSSLAARTNGTQVSVRSERHRETFELGRRSFVNEAQLLAAFDQPSLVKVYRFWEQNGTAYMVMPYYQGPTLKQWILERGSPTEAWLHALLAPLLDALELMHHSRCYHRDIAPDNILLLQTTATQLGAPPPVRPVLLDFGAARRVISDATQALTVILKPGYAPIEQYAESSSMKQGAWTDVYALCAVLYAAVTGRAPTASVSRIVTDEMVPAVEAGAGRFSEGFLRVIDAGLAVRPAARPQDMAALREMLAAVAPVPGRAEARASRPAPLDGAADGDVAVRDVPAAASGAPDVTLMAPARPAAEGAAQLASSALGPLPADAHRGAHPPVPSAGLAAAGASEQAAGLHQPGQARGVKSATTPPTQAPATSAGGRRSAAPKAAAGAVLLLGATGAVWWAMRPPAPEEDGPRSVPTVAAAPASAPASAVAPAPAAASSVAPPPVAPPAVPFSIVGSLQDIVRQADPLLGVNVLADKSSLVINRDRLQFRVKSKEAGYVYVFLGGTDKNHFYLLFPNHIDRNNRIAANTEVTLPRKSWSITAGGPPGTNHIVTMVSRVPRDFTSAGLRGAGDEIPEFDLARAEQLWATRQPGENPFVGRPQCEAGAPCDGGYGASLLEVDEVARAK